MSVTKTLWLAVALVFVQAAPAAAQTPRQYYSRYWQKQGNYYYRQYYYKPSPKAPGYRFQYVIYYPTKPRYYYYYNPYSSRYWGRYDRSTDGYAALAKDKQRPRITE